MLKLALVVLLSVTSFMKATTAGGTPGHPGTESLESTFLLRFPPRDPVVDVKYQGGAVMSDPIKLYPICYGNSPQSFRAAVRTAILSLTPAHLIKDYPNLANWWKIVTEYQSTPPKGSHVSNSVSIGGDVDDLYSQGTNYSDLLTDPAFSSILNNAKLKLKLPKKDTVGNVLLFTSGDVTVTGYPSKKCPLHDVLNGSLIFAFTPLSSSENTLSYPCNYFSDIVFTAKRILGTPPNAKASPDGALDSLVSIMMKMANTPTDPTITLAWTIDSNSDYDVGETCDYIFGGGDYYYTGIDAYGNLSLLPGFPTESWPGSTQVLVDEKSGVGFNLFGIVGSRF